MANGRRMLQLGDLQMLHQRMHLLVPMLPFSGVRADVWSSELPQLLLLLRNERIMLPCLHIHW